MESDQIVGPRMGFALDGDGVSLHLEARLQLEGEVVGPQGDSVELGVDGWLGRNHSGACWLSD